MKLRVSRIASAVFWLAIAGVVGSKVWPQVSAAFDLRSSVGGMPALAVHTISGGAISLDGLRGQVVLVNFWATWCPPCEREMPGFERVYRSRRKDGFTILALSTDATGDAVVRRFIAAHGITFPVAMATHEAKGEFGGIRGLPTSFLIDRSGRLRHTVPGLFSESALRLAVDRLLAEEAPGAISGIEAHAAPSPPDE